MVTGRVTDAATSAPLPGGVLDVWQTDAQGLYSNQLPGRAEFHLRWKVPVCGDGTNRFRTVTPPSTTSPRTVLSDGGCERSDGTRSGRRTCTSRSRPTGYRPLTTMVFFEGDEYLESDAIGAVKGPLVAKLERDADGAVCRFDVALA